MQAIMRFLFPSFGMARVFSQDIFSSSGRKLVTIEKYRDELQQDRFFMVSYAFEGGRKIELGRDDARKIISCLEAVIET